MTPPGRRIRELSRLRSELKSEGKCREAIPLQLEIIQLNENSGASPETLAGAHSEASILYLNSGLYDRAEEHARRALALASAGTPREAEARGCHSYILAMTLAAQNRFEEAVPYGESAVRDFRVSHTSPDVFLSKIIEAVEEIRLGKWLPPNG